MKKESLLALGFIAIFAGCTGSTKTITLPSGDAGQKMDVSIRSDKSDYLSEDYIAKKAGIFTFIAMKTSARNNNLYVEVRRSDMHDRRAKVYSFMINDIKPSNCTYIEKGKRATRECIFDKKRVYSSYEKRGKLIYDESANGKKSASVECLKKYPKPSSFSVSWVNNMEKCISDSYKMSRSNTPVENRLRYNQLMYTSKHYKLDIGEAGKFKQFLFGQ